MSYFLLGCAALALGAFLLERLARIPPPRLALGLRRGMGLSLFIAALPLALSGRYSAALSLTGLGMIVFGARVPIAFGPAALLYPLFSWLFSGSAAGGGSRRRRKRSQIRTRLVAMTLDHDSGEMSGVILDGPHRDRELSSCSIAELEGLLELWRREDAESARLLETYLERRQAAGAAGAGASGGASGRPGAMSRDEALRTLGLAEGATEEEIRRAHRALIAKWHPDRGGSEASAARINQARDVLLGTASGGRA